MFLVLANELILFCISLIVLVLIIFDSNNGVQSSSLGWVNLLKFNKINPKMVIIS